MINAPFEVLGYLVIGLFAISLTVSIILFRCSKSSSSEADRPSERGSE